jgi:hypothetical protein
MGGISEGKMKKLSFVLVLGILAGVFVAAPVLAQEEIPVAEQLQGSSNENADQSEQPAEDSSEQTSDGHYNYVGQADDTYSQIARKAIQTYGLETGTNLSGAQIVFAETNMTIEAGSQLLEVGQEISIEKSIVKGWVEKAQKLSETEEAGWDYYVQFVDFNTNSVGEAS